jgi:methionyl-tRNA synthetase
LQGEKVRKLKTSGAEKSVWQPEVEILLDLKKKLAAANSSTPKPGNEKSASELEAAVAQQVIIKCIFNIILIL